MYDPLNHIPAENQENQTPSAPLSGEPEQPQASASVPENTNPSTSSAPSTPSPELPHYAPEQGGYSQQSWGGQPAQTVWNGSSYHSSPAQPSFSQGAPSPDGKPKKAKKRSRFWLKATACVLACALVSGGSIAGFIGLVNGGYITLNSSQTSSGSGVVQNLINDTNFTSSGSTNPVGTSDALTLQEAAKKALPSVVCIQNYQRVQQNQGGYFPGTTPGDTEEEQDASEGSGIIATSDGYIITNAHVVEDADSLKVVLYDGSKYEAELIGSDTVTDLAVIKIDATGLTAAEFGDSDALQVADQVLAIGNPGGMELQSSTTVGYISALDRSITTESGYTMNCIQTDAAINPGNSGGALVNIYGQVIGINSSKIAQTEYEGLGFAIPINYAQTIVNSLKEYGYVKDRAVLGISGQFIDSWTAQFYGLEPGMYVGEISNPSVSQAGITQGCIITKIDDTQVSSSTSITAYISSQKKAGDVVTLEVYHPDGQHRRIISLLTPQAEVVFLFSPSAFPPKFSAGKNFFPALLVFSLPLAELLLHFHLFLPSFSLSQ